MNRPLTIAALIAIALGLSACNSITATLDPRGKPSPDQPPLLAPPASLATPAPTTQPAPAPTPPSQTATPPSPTILGVIDSQGAAISSLERVQLAPVVGATVDAATPLSKRLETRGKEKRIDFRGEGAPGSKYVLKGYFSLEGTSTGGIIHYVWDVLDPAGNRVHRINGQENVSGKGAGKWPGVPASAMEKVADKTVDELAMWIGSQRG